MARIRRTAFITGLLLFLFAALIAACADEEDPVSEAPVDVDEEFAIHEITVTEDGLEPSEIEVRAPEKAELVVRNESETACTFDFGPYVRSLEVPAGEESQMAFIVEDLATLEAGDPEFLAMGCQGDERQGEIRVLTSTAQ